MAYYVTKTIKGRKYVYWQRTYRVGKQVKTQNKYIGPAHSVSIGALPAASKYEAITQHYSPENQRKLHYSAIQQVVKPEARGPEYEKVNRAFPVKKSGSHLDPKKKYILWDRRDETDYGEGNTFTPSEAMEEIRTIYAYDARNEDVDIENMSMEEFLEMNEDWELREVE